MIKTIGLMALAIGFSGAALAQQFTNGTYAVEGGSYQITVEQRGDALVVVEPNKTSSYTRQADGSYHFYNPNTNATYGLRVVDARTIEAFKPVPGNTPTRLVLIGGAPSAPATLAANDGWGAMAAEFEALAKSDPDNAHVWTTCAAAAHVRSGATDAEFAEYVQPLVQMIKPIMVDPSANPCPKAIPDGIW